MKTLTLILVFPNGVAATLNHQMAKTVERLCRIPRALRSCCNKAIWCVFKPDSVDRYSSGDFQRGPKFRRMFVEYAVQSQ